MKIEKFNINDKVRVRLTPLGYDIINEKTAEIKKIFPSFQWPVKADENGWATYQLWELMQTFGGYIGNGCQVPFETEIEILFPDA